MQSFIGYCAYVGSSLADGHWLGTFCRNNMTAVFGYNYTWSAHLPPVPCYISWADCSSFQDRLGSLRRQQWLATYRIRRVQLSLPRLRWSLADRVFSPQRKLLVQLHQMQPQPRQEDARAYLFLPEPGRAVLHIVP
jgi:hypothetical protein